MKRILLLLLVFIASNSVTAQISVAIIGGGMSGVSCAHYIKQLDTSNQISVTLYEKEELLGGNARTVKVPNINGQEIMVDAGPQYFAEGPWDEYISLLEHYKLYNEEDFSSFSGSFVIDHSTKGNSFVSPKDGKLRESFKRLMQFKKFYNAARDAYLHPDGNYPKAIGPWVESLENTPEFKTTVIYPFLASTLGTTIDEIKGTSTHEVVKLFAFRPALKKGEFVVSQKGMGTLIQTMGKSLESKGVVIHRGDEVLSLKGKKNGYHITSKTGTEIYDFVIFATHPYQAAKILDTQKSPDPLVETLKKFKYFTAQIVLHSDSSFVNNETPAFLNIRTQGDSHSVTSNTMNLSVIDQRFNGIYKSWLNDDDLAQLKQSGKFLHRELFYHPLISPEFKQSLQELHELENMLPSLHFAGGWTQGLETQETAIISGRKAANKVYEYLIKKGDLH